MASKEQLADMKQMYHYMIGDKDQKITILTGMAHELQEAVKTGTGKDLDLDAAMMSAAVHMKKSMQNYGNDAETLKNAIYEAELGQSGSGFLHGAVIDGGRIRIGSEIDASLPSKGNATATGTSLDLSYGAKEPAFGAANQAGISVGTNLKGNENVTAHTEFIPGKEGILGHTYATASVTAGDGIKTSQTLGLFTKGHIPGTQDRDYSLYGAVAANQQFGGDANKAAGKDFSHGESLVFRAGVQALGTAGKTNAVEAGALVVAGVSGTDKGAVSVGGEIIYTPWANAKNELTLKFKDVYNVETQDNTASAFIQLNTDLAQ